MRSNKALLTVKETAQSLSISQSKLYTLIAARQIKTVKIGRATRIPAEAIQEFIASLPSTEVYSR